MDKSGEKWWKMEGKQWNGDMSWGIEKLGHEMRKGWKILLDMAI